MPELSADSDPARRSVSVGGGPPASPSSRRRSLTLASALTVAVAALVLGFGYAGMAPWSGDLPGFHAAHSAVGTTIGFALAAQVASSVASGASGGPWSLMDAAGVDSAVAIQFPGGGSYGGNSSGGPLTTGGCTSATIPSLVLPASTGPLGHGLAAAWLFQFQNSSGDVLGITVLNGAGSVVFQTRGSACTNPDITYSPIAGNVIDSTTAAGIANSWGGAAFLANYSASIALYSITGAFTVQEGWYFPPPTEYNNSSLGNQSPPPPIPANFTYTSPSLWQVLDSTCSLFAPSSGPAASFTASLAPVNGTVVSESAYSSYGGCYGYPGPPTPPGPVYGSGTGSPVPF